MRSELVKVARALDDPVLNENSNESIVQLLDQPNGRGHHLKLAAVILFIVAVGTASLAVWRRSTPPVSLESASSVASTVTHTESTIATAPQMSEDWSTAGLVGLPSAGRVDVWLGEHRGRHVVVSGRLVADGENPCVKCSLQIAVRSDGAWVPIQDDFSALASDGFHILDFVSNGDMGMILADTRSGVLLAASNDLEHWHAVPGPAQIKGKIIRLQSAGTDFALLTTNTSSTQVYASTDSLDWVSLGEVVGAASAVASDSSGVVALLDGSVLYKFHRGQPPETIGNLSKKSFGASIATNGISTYVFASGSSPSYKVVNSQALALATGPSFDQIASSIALNDAGLVIGAYDGLGGVVRFAGSSVTGEHPAKALLGDHVTNASFVAARLLGSGDVMIIAQSDESSYLTVLIYKI